MKRTSFRHYDLSQSDRKNLNISVFKGVDYSAQKFLIADDRAMDLLNYIYKDGCIQKRNGLEVIANADKIKYIDYYDTEEEIKENTNNFNGLWQFLAEDKEVHIIAHIGKLLFEIKDIDDIDKIKINPFKIEEIQSENGEKIPVCYEFLDEKTTAYIGDNKLWFFGGNKYMCLRYLSSSEIQFFEVENSALASVPTTTISITYNDSISGGHRSSLDKVNLLTQWRKNKLLSGTGKNENVEVQTKYYEYDLDSPIIACDEEDYKNITLLLKTRGVLASGLTIENPSETEWRVLYCPTDLTLDEEENRYIFYYAGTEISNPPFIELDKDIYELVKGKYIFAFFREKNTSNTQSIKRIASTILGTPLITKPILPYFDIDNVEHEQITFSDEYSAGVLGYLDNVGNVNKNGKVILFKDFKPESGSENNITITFPCYEKSNADKINKCRFGINFGANNSHNRLFVSGNKDYPNCDWYSGVISGDDITNGNYGYFEDTSQNYYGNSQNAVVGYDIVSNNKLLVLKNKNNKEKTIYFRTPQLVEAIDASGNSLLGINESSLYQEEFSRTEGNSSVGGVSFNSITNFNGDTLFLSNEKNIVGLDLEGIIGDNQRYANSRSIYIDNALKNIDLTKAWIWSNNKYLLLVLEDKIFITHYQTKTDDQYEWWLMDIKNINAILELDEKIFLGDNKGNLYSLTDSYENIDRYFLKAGDFSLDSEDETKQTLVLNNEVISEIKSDSKSYLSLTNSTNYMQQLATIGNDNNDFKINVDLNCLELCCADFESKKKLLSMFVDNLKLYIGNEEYSIRSFFNENTYLLNDCFKVYGESNEEITLDESFNGKVISQKLNGRYEIVDINQNKSTIRIKDENGDYVVFSKIDESNNEASVGRLEILTSVKAFYISKPLTFGSLNSFKTIWSITLTNDTNIPSELELGIVNNKIPYEKSKTLVSVSKEKLGFDLNELSFHKIDFEKNIVPRTFTFQRILSQLKFTNLIFKNYSNTNSVLCSMSILYTIPFPSYGSN